MHEPLVFRGRLNEEDVCWIQRYLWQLTFRRPFRWRAVVFLTLVAASVTWWAVETRTPAGIWFVLVWVGLGIAWPLEQRWATRRHYRKYEAEYRDTEVTLATDWIRIENDAIRSEFKWPLVGLVIDAREGLLFCNQANQCLFWLPERILGGDRREQVLRLARRNDAVIRRMS